MGVRSRRGQELGAAKGKRSLRDGRGCVARCRVTVLLLPQYAGGDWSMRARKRPLLPVVRALGRWNCIRASEDGETDWVMRQKGTITSSSVIAKLAASWLANSMPHQSSRVRGLRCGAPQSQTQMPYLSRRYLLSTLLSVRSLEDGGGAAFLLYKARNPVSSLVFYDWNSVRSSVLAFGHDPSWSPLHAAAVDNPRG